MLNAGAEESRGGAKGQPRQDKGKSSGAESKAGPSTRAASKTRASGEVQGLQPAAEIVAGRSVTQRERRDSSVSSSSAVRSYPIGTPPGQRTPGSRSKQSSPARSDASRDSHESETSNHSEKSVRSVLHGQEFIDYMSSSTHESDGSDASCPADFVMCIDGTGNDMLNEKPEKYTNITKILQLLKDGRQGDRIVNIAYQQGLGNHGDSETNHKKNDWYQELRGTFNKATPRPSLIASMVASNYTYICTNICPARDRLMVFGFSRGAYIAQLTTALVADVGIFDNESYLASPHNNSRINYTDIIREIVEAWIESEGDMNDKKWKRKAEKYEQCLMPMEISFLGLFDMVASVGLFPKTAVLDFTSKKFQFAERIDVRPMIREAHHAVSLSEHRLQFTPVLWKGLHNNRYQTVSQVGFPGYHASIGGGTDHQGLMIYYITLVWMLSKCTILHYAIKKSKLETMIRNEVASDRAQEMQTKKANNEPEDIPDSKAGGFKLAGDHYRKEFGEEDIDVLHVVCREREWNTYCPPKLPPTPGTKTEAMIKALKFDLPEYFERQWLEVIRKAWGMEGSKPLSLPSRKSRGKFVVLPSPS